MLVSTSGFAFNVHYCGEEIASVSSIFAKSQVETENAEACCIEKAKENKTCCSDKVVKIKGKADVVVKTFDLKISAFVPVDYASIAVRIFQTAEIEPRQFFIYDGGSNGPPLYKLYHQLLFYA